MFNRASRNVQAISLSSYCSKITSFASSAIVTVAKMGSTLWAIKATQNFILQQEEGGLSDHWESITAAVIAGTAVTVSNIVTKVILMQYTAAPAPAAMGRINFDNDDFMQDATSASPAAEIKPTQCNPGIDTHSHPGYVLLKSINLAYGGYILINSAQSANSYQSGNNIGANALFGVLAFGSMRTFMSATLPQNMSAYKNLIVDRGFYTLPMGALLISFINAAAFAINVFFTTKKSLTTLQENTLAYMTDKSIPFEALTAAASLFAGCALISSCFNTSNARYKNKQTNFTELLKKAKSPTLQKCNIAIISSILISDSAFAAMIAASTAQFPATIHESYKDFTYTPWMIAIGGFFGIVNFATSVEMDMRSYAYTLEKITEAEENKAVIKGSIQIVDIDTPSENIILSSSRNSIFSELRQKLIIDTQLTVDVTRTATAESEEDLEVREITMRYSPSAEDSSSTDNDSRYTPMNQLSP
jgi:hypothetical protein